MKVGVWLAPVVACALLAPSCRSTGTHVSVADGRDLYEANGCATCHGVSGRGDGSVGKTLSPPPRDFRDESSYTNGSDQDSIAATLAHGIDRNGAKMPAFAHLTDDERRSLALFVISLRNPKEERTIR